MKKATKRIELRLPPDLKRRWREAAKAAGLTMTEWARRAIERVTEAKSDGNAQ